MLAGNSSRATDPHTPPPLPGSRPFLSTVPQKHPLTSPFLSGTAEDEMVGWRLRLNGHEVEQALGDGERQGSLVCRSPRGGKELDTTERLNNDNPLLKTSAPRVSRVTDCSSLVWNQRLLATQGPCRGTPCPDVSLSASPSARHVLCPLRGVCRQPASVIHGQMPGSHLHTNPGPSCVTWRNEAI